MLVGAVVVYGDGTSSEAGRAQPRPLGREWSTLRLQLLARSLRDAHPPSASCKVLASESQSAPVVSLRREPEDPHPALIDDLLEGRGGLASSGTYSHPSVAGAIGHIDRDVVARRVLHGDPLDDRRRLDQPTGSDHGADDGHRGRDIPEANTAIVLTGHPPPGVVVVVGPFIAIAPFVRG